VAADTPPGPVSEMGRRYLQGQMRQSQLQGQFTVSRREQVSRPEVFSAAERQKLLALARHELQRQRVVFGVLAAGASTRMNLQDLPPSVVSLLRDAGKNELPSSKALVPVGCFGGRTQTYLDLFLTNVQRFRHQTATHNPILLFVSEANAQEIADHLHATSHHGLPETDVLVFQQPLAPQIVAREEDVTRAEKNFAAADLAAAREYSRRFAGHDLPQRKPAGHGEFLHQLVASGMLAELAAREVRYISVRNIDNASAALDETWMLALGYLLAEKAHMLVEVSQRPVGQKGGALIRRANGWRLAEDPSFSGTSYHASDSYFINNAVAILGLDYFFPIYETSLEELLAVRQLPAAERQARWVAMADQGRRKFPTIVEAKPVRLNDGRCVAAITPETNMWESTDVDQRLRILPLAVDSDRDAGEDLLDQPPDEQRRRALQVRFCPTKNWDDYEDPRKKRITACIAERIVSGQLIEG
jgi:hypothetical protein